MNSVQENCSTKPSKKKTKNKRKQCSENGTTAPSNNGHAAQSTQQQQHQTDRLGEKLKQSLRVTVDKKQQQHNGTDKSLTNGGPSSSSASAANGHDEPRLNGDCNISKSRRNPMESNSCLSNGQKEHHNDVTGDGLSNGNRHPSSSRSPSPVAESKSQPQATEKADGENNDQEKQQNELSPVIAQPAINLENIQIEYKEYESELQMHDIMRLIQAELSEPYSIYTYRYFIYNWPKLCFLAAHGNEYVGAIVCKLDMHMNVKRGYIAMLAVRREYRKLKIGTTLVQKAIEAMLADNADEVVLETEMRNIPALRLYENLGFVRDKRLFRYYLNGVDALRLKLWFR